MAKINSFRDVISLWPNRAAFAKAIGVEYNTAQMMDMRSAIAGKHFNRVVEGAAQLGFPEVTHALLLRLTEQRATERAAERAAKKRRRAA